IARLQMRHQRGIHRGHAGRGRAARLGTFQLTKPLLQHGDCRIGEARILVMVDSAGERRFGLFGIVVDEAGGEKQRFGRLSEMAALHAAMHKAGGRTVGFWIGCHLSGPLCVMARPLEQLRPGSTGVSLASLARFFHLAAIRPDKSRGPGLSGGGNLGRTGTARQPAGPWIWRHARHAGAHYARRTLTVGNPSNATSTVVGPVSQSGGVTLPSMTTWPARKPPNAAATDDPASQARPLNGWPSRSAVIPSSCCPSVAVIRPRSAPTSR